MADNALTIARDPPVQVNPLAAITAGNAAASGVYDLRDKQGQMLWGQALQQSTDPATGVVDYNKANRIAATMGPAAAQAAARNLQNNSALTGAQISQASVLHGLLGNMSMSLMNDPSDENMAKIRGAAVASNLPPGTLAEIDRIAALPSAQRGAEAYKHAISNLDTLGQLARSPYAMPTLTTVGDRAVPVQVTPNTPWSGGGAVVQPGGVTIGPPAGSTFQPTEPFDDQGIIPRDANGNPTRPPKGYMPVTKPTSAIPGIPTGGQQVPGGGGRGSQSPPTPPKPGVSIPTGYVPPGGTPAAPAAPVAPPGVQMGGAPPAPPGAAPGAAATPYTGGGIGTVLAPAGVGPRSDIGAPNSNVAAILQGMQRGGTAPLAGSAMTAGPGAPTSSAWAALASDQMPQSGFGSGIGTYGAGPSAPAAPVPAVSVPATSAAPAAVKPPAIMAPPQGQPEQLQADQKQFIAERTALPQRQTQEQNLVHAYDALKLITTGKGVELASSVRNSLATLGLLPKGPVSDETALEIFRKYTERTIADAGNAGGTDAARAVAAASNPGTPLLTGANLAFLRNDIGKVRQQMATYLDAPDKTIGAGFGNHAANIASNTDPRGFAWDLYSKAEQTEILKSVGDSGAAHDALARAIGKAQRLFPSKGAGPVVPHSQAVPLTPPSNALAMAQPQSNPLLAA